MRVEGQPELTEQMKNRTKSNVMLKDMWDK